MNMKNLSPEQKARAKAFKAALDSLLKEHSCTLGGNFDGDSHGVYNERFEFTFRPTKNANGAAFTVVLNDEGTHYPD